MTAGTMLVFPYDTVNPHQPVKRLSHSEKVKVTDWDKSGNKASGDSSAQSPPASHPKLKRTALPCHTSRDSGFHESGSESHSLQESGLSRNSSKDTQSPEYSSPENSQVEDLPRDKVKIQLGCADIEEEGADQQEPVSPYCNGSITDTQTKKTTDMSEKKTKMRLDLGSNPPGGKRSDLPSSPPGRKMLKSPSEPMFHSAHSNIGNGDASPGSPMKTPQADISLDTPLGSPPSYAQIRHFAQSPVVQFRHMPIAKNPYMSPYLAREDLVDRLPPVYLVVSNSNLFDSIN